MHLRDSKQQNFNSNNNNCHNHLDNSHIRIFGNPKLKTNLIYKFNSRYLLLNLNQVQI